MEIIEKIKGLGLRQREIAEKTDLSIPSISDILAGKQKPRKHVIRLLEYAFGERKTFKNPNIEAVAKIMEKLTPEGQAEVLKAAEKEKIVQEVRAGK